MMSERPFKSLVSYSQFVAEQMDRPAVQRSTVVVWSDSPYTGTTEGEVFFVGGIRLRMHEEIDFDSERITSYGYEVYQNDEKIYWYDDFPHPGDPTLASTFPHHKHVSPDIKRHRNSGARSELLTAKSALHSRRDRAISRLKGGPTPS